MALFVFPISTPLFTPLHSATAFVQDLAILCHSNNPPTCLSVHSLVTSDPSSTQQPERSSKNKNQITTYLLLNPFNDSLRVSNKIALGVMTCMIWPFYSLWLYFPSLPSLALGEEATLNCSWGNLMNWGRVVQILSMNTLYCLCAFLRYMAMCYSVLRIWGYRSQNPIG